VNRDIFDRDIVNCDIVTPGDHPGLDPWRTS